MPAFLSAQSLTQGAITGTVFDPTHAVVANATVNLKNLDTGATEVTATNDTGAYHFNLLKPGNYQVAVEPPGFAEIQVSTVVAVGQTSNVDINLEVRKTSETIEVLSNTPLLVLDPSSSTSFTQEEVQRLPSPGGDITNIAQTAPGVVVNTQGGLGNFTVNGLPATSNLFTVNGEDDMDPYNNVNNSGASNLTVGQNEISEATVVTNPYSGQYGQFSGAQVTMITKSGTNNFHGNAQYWWNGRAMNANNWLNNFYRTPRPFANANQWAAGFGGPIRKNSTFFFVDTEGLRFILPNSDQVYTFTPAFASAVEANVANVQPNEAATYNKMFDYYLHAPGVSRAAALVANDDECNNLSLPGFDPNTQACSALYRATATSFAKEWILAFRLDQRLGNKDDAYFRYKIDHGQQPSYIDLINPIFDANSKQPSWDAQISETHVFGPRATNSVMATLSWYNVLFEQNTEAVVAAFPYGLDFFGSAFPYYNMNPMYLYPSGRRFTQYQFIDDFSLNRGKHNFKFGVNFRRYDVSDQSFSYKYPLVFFRDADPFAEDGLQNFVDGLAAQYRRAFIPNADVPIALWGIGLYAQDEWNVRHNLKLSVGLRVDRSSNPVCQSNCFSNFGSSWQNLPSYQAFLAGVDPGDVPYSSDLKYNQHRAFPGTDSINWSPRIGFTWSPRGDNKTVISGGFGIFYDALPVGLLDVGAGSLGGGILANPPTSVALRVRPPTGTPPFDTTANGAAATFAASAAAFSITQSYNTIAATLPQGVVFTPPGINAVAGTLHNPRWQEWNFRVQRELNRTTALALNYFGNHGIRLPYGNSWLNAYDPFCAYSAGFSCADNLLNPFAPAVPNYGTVSQIQSGAVSNYNGLTASLRRQFSHGISAHINYTWSHNLDEASNGGLSSYGSDSLVTQLSPFGLRNENYGNSDYDVRHSFNADYVVSPQFHLNNTALGWLINGWQWSGKWFWHSGLPFSVTDGAAAAYLFNTSASVMATPLVGGTGPMQHSCGRAAVTTPCLDASAYVDSFALDFNGFTSWPTQRRNQYRGPGFFDMDMSLFKTFRVRERWSFGIGLQAYNVFNHPNFANPASEIEGSIPFGTITSMQGTPTSPYGNHLGFDSSARVAQLSAKIEF